MDQDRLLSSLMVISSPKRRRRRSDESNRKPNMYTVQYLIRKDTDEVPVCAKFFSALFNVSRRRLNTIASTVKQSRNICERRGGDRKSTKYEAKKKSVMDFIARLPARESHYSRKKSKRLYLSSDLSINKLYKFYNSNAIESLRVKKTFFYNIFSTEFNLGFGNPATDTCSYCMRMTHLLKTVTDEREKTKLKTELSVHKMKSDAFYKLMKKKLPNTASFCFDLQQVQPLPKLSIGESYYSRQVSCYAFCITDLHNKSPVFYTWTENESGRGSVEVASALIHFLENCKIDECIDTIRLFSGGCGGQNRNSHVVHALTMWLLRKSPTHVRRVSMTFPMRGHSYLPADRVFGVLEKSFRKHAEIINPQSYIELYREVGPVKILGIDWQIKDIKQLSRSMKMLTGISDMKRIFLQKTIKTGNNTVTMKMEPTYNFDDPSKPFVSLLKKGIKYEGIPEAEILPMESRVNAAKKKDVDHLLKKRFGNDWRKMDKLQFYVKVIDEQPAFSSNELGDEGDCDCLEEEMNDIV